MESNSKDESVVGDELRNLDNPQTPPKKKSNAFVEFLSQSDEPKEDGPYGWVVVVAAFFCHFIALGYLYSFGVFILPLVNEFNVGRGVVSWVGSLTNATMLMLSLPTSQLSNRFGFPRLIALGGVLLAIALISSSFMPRIEPMYITYGLLGGFGICLSYIPVVSCVGQWFKKYRSIATGIAVAGSGVGNVAFPPIANALIASVGWRNGMRILAIGSIFIVIGSFFLKQRVPLTSRITISALKEFWKSKTFLLLWISSVFAGFGFLVPFVHIVAFAKDVGIGAEKGAYLLSIMGGASAIGRVSLGFLSDRFGKIRVFKINMACIPIVYIIWIYTKTFGGLIPVCFCIGFLCGGFVSLLPPVLADYFTVAKLPLALGLVFPMAGVGSILGPPMTGLMFDEFGSYTIAIYVAAACMFTNAVIVFFLPAPPSEIKEVVIENDPPNVRPSAL